MINLIKADLYKISKSKMTRMVLNIITIFTIILNIFIVNFGTSLGVLTINENNGFYFGFEVSEPLETTFLKTSLAFSIVIAIGLLFIIVDIIKNAYKSGTFKLELAYGEKREKVYISKIVGVSIFIIISFLLCNIITIIIWNLFLGKSLTINSEFIGHYLKTIAMVMLTLIAIASFYTLIGIIFKDCAEVVGAALAFWTLFPMFISSYITNTENPAVLMFILRRICGNPNNTVFWGNHAIIAFIYIVIFSLIGVFIFKKQDI